MSNSIDYDTVSFVTRSEPRLQALRVLSEGPAVPSDIATETGTDLAHVSRALQELRDRNQVELLVDEDTKKGRYYGITDQGSQIYHEVQERDLA